LEAMILEMAPFQLDREQLKKTLRIKEGSGVGEKVEALAQEAEAVGRPKICYGVAYVESKGEDHLVIEGVTFTSRILRVNLDKVFRVFPYVATCGPELEEWSRKFDGILEKYWADTIKEMAVRSTVRYLQDHLTERYRPGPMSRMNPGSLPDWPLPEQRPLFALLGENPAKIGVQLKESFLMTPVKSVSGIWFPTEERFESCQLCQRENCPGRRAPYDPSLYDRKYR
jgi:hypothetical protein